MIFKKIVTMTNLNNEDEDYEISNKLIDEYLCQHDTNYNDFLIENDVINSALKNNSHTETIIANELLSIDSDSNESTSYNFLLHLFDKTSLKRIFEKNPTSLNQTIEKFDLDFINETYLHFLNQYRASFLNHRHWHHSKALIATISILLISIYSFQFFYFAFFVLFIFLTFTLFLKLILNFLFDFYITKWLTLACTYSRLVKNLLTFFKEAEFVNFSVNRRYFVEKREEIKSLNLSHDTLNFKFRKYMFLKLRRQFYSFRELNLQFDLSKSNLVDLISTIDKNDLADVLKLTTSNALVELEHKTDHFSLSCLKTMSQLNRYVLSENFKITVVTIFASILSTRSLLTSIRIYWATIYMLFKVLKMIKKSIDELVEFEMVLKMSHPVPIKSEQKKFNPDVEKSLALYLRNALLNSYELKTSSNKLDSLKMLKCNFEFCQFYLKQLISSLEKNASTNNESGVVENDGKLSPNLSLIKQVEVPKEVILPPTIEDEIYEVDMTKTIEESEQNTLAEDWEFEQKKKEVNFANKNLFYELKFALKFKSNEWTERERLAKKRMLGLDANLNNGKNSSEFDILLANDYLLDNDTLRYKSSLSKSRKLGLKGYLDEFENQTKEKKKYVYENAENDSLNGVETEVASNQFFGEFMNKRSFLFQNNDETIVYE